MSQSPQLKWAITILLVIVAGLLLTSLRVTTDPVDDTNELRSTSVATTQENQAAGMAIDDPTADKSGTVGSGSLPCLTFEQLEYHPALVQDSYRFDAVSDSGPTVSSYRGLSEQELHDLTAQGDSAAMAVMGAMSVMRAREWPVEKAVPYLTLEDPDLMSFRFTRPHSPEFLNHMAQARRWFYKAALHGRVLALGHVGEALSFEQGGPIELGWIDQAEYDNFSSYEKTALMPSNLYNVLAYEIAPELRSGPHGEILAQLMPRTERQQVIVDRLAEQFHRDLQDAGLPPIVVAKSAAPPIEDLLLLLCESERERLEKARENAR